MSIPRVNKWVTSALAGTSFTTSIPVLNDYSGAVHIVFAGLDASDAYVRLKGDNTGTNANARNLHTDATTLTTANSSFLFDLRQMGFEYLVLEYDAGANTVGTISAFLSRKQVS